MLYKYMKISYIYIHNIASILHTHNFTVYMHIHICVYIFVMLFLNSDPDVDIAKFAKMSHIPPAAMATKQPQVILIELLLPLLRSPVGTMKLRTAMWDPPKWDCCGFPG